MRRFRQVDTANWEPYTPFGWEGVCQGAAVVFFAFLGFDASTALGAETVDPARTIPKARRPAAPPLHRAAGTNCCDPHSTSTGL